MFSAAEKIVRAIAALMTPISQSVYPHIARLSMQSPSSALDFVRKLLWGQGAVMCMLSVLLFMSAEPLVRLLFGHGYSDGGDILRWLAVLPLLIGVSNVLGVQTMLNFGLQGAFGRIVLGCGLLNLLLLMLLVPRYGGLGAAASVVVIELAVVAAMGTVLARAGLLSAVLRRKAA
jgi:PST family polysaccharide transporter